jgi:glycosyltransferase involved in cell wall biosynthesis/GT2 family glycosyltransferase
MSIAVVVVNYNGGSEIVNNLRVIESQCPDWDIVVVDNASNDGSVDAIRAAVPRARVVIASRNRGYAAGVNRGLDEAGGSHVLILNPDVAPVGGALQAMGRAVEAHPDFGILGAFLVAADGQTVKTAGRDLPTVPGILREGFFLPVRMRGMAGRKPSGGPEIVEVPMVSGAVMAVGREALDRLGPMCDDFFLYHEDSEWCRRAHERGLRVGLVRGAEFAHAGGLSTRGREGPAFAARVLSDFQYFCDIEGQSAERIRRIWLCRLRFRALGYRMESAFRRAVAVRRRGNTQAKSGTGRRERSRRRAAIYALLADALVRFRWSQDETGQNAHPSRLMEFPEQRFVDPDDKRPLVLHVIPNMEFGGAQRIVEATVEGSLGSRFRFAVLCLTHIGEIGEELRLRGLDIFVAGLKGWRRPADWRRAADIEALYEPDLVHSHLLPGDIAAYFGFRRRVPWVSTKHSVDLWMTAISRAAERFALRRVQLVLAVSGGVAGAKAYLGRRGVLPVVVQSPPTVSLAEQSAPLFRRGERIRLVMLGRLHRVKRVDLFLRMAAQLEQLHPGHFDFRVVGDGPERERLERLSDELGVRELVELRHAVSDVAAELDNADLVLLLSDHEGFPLVLPEALARGRVPIVRRTHGLEEALPPALSDCFVDGADPEAVAAKVLEVCDDHDRYREMVANARTWVAARVDYGGRVGQIYDDALAHREPRERTRVLHIITRLIVGGAQENTIASVARVAPDRYDSRLWVGPQTGSEGSLLDEARTLGIVPYVLSNLVREISPFSDLAVLVQLVRLIRQGRFDIVHTHSSKAGIVGRLAARLAGVPHIVHTIHGWGFHEHMNPARRWFYVTLEKLLEPMTHVLISVSERTTRVGLEAGIGSPDVYRLIRSGIPLSRFHRDEESRLRLREEMGVKRDDLVIGTVGRLSLQKNPADFVHVAVQLSRRFRNLRFVYVGDGPLRASVESEIAEAGLSDRVSLLGIRSDVDELLRAMDIFILTSLWEGLPRVVPQALATGVPVVAYDTAGIRESVVEGRNGFLVAPGAIDDMVERLSRLVEDRGLRDGMSRNAIEEFDCSFSEETMIDGLGELYDELTSGDPPPV